MGGERKFEALIDEQRSRRGAGVGRADEEVSDTDGFAGPDDGAAIAAGSLTMASAASSGASVIAGLMTAGSWKTRISLLSQPHVVHNGGYGLTHFRRTDEPLRLLSCRPCPPRTTP